MDKIREDLNNLGKEIEQAKTNISQLEGRREEIINRCYEEFGVSSEEKIKILLDTLGKELNKLEKEIQTDYAELKKVFSW